MAGINPMNWYQGQRSDESLQCLTAMATALTGKLIGYDIKCQVNNHILFLIESQLTQREAERRERDSQMQMSRLMATMDRGLSRPDSNHGDGGSTFESTG